MASVGWGETGGAAWVLPPPPAARALLRPQALRTRARAHRDKAPLADRAEAIRPAPSASRPLHKPAPGTCPTPPPLSCLSLWDTFPEALNQGGAPVLGSGQGAEDRARLSEVA